MIRPVIPGLALTVVSLVALIGSPATAAQPAATSPQTLSPPGHRLFSVDQELVDAGLLIEAPTTAAFSCIPDGSVDDTLGRWSCCSGYAVSGSTVCTVASDFGTTWQSCRHVCGTAPVNGCIPSGGTDDTLSKTFCCSHAAVPGSTWCLNPADYGTSWASCVQTCQ